MLVLAQVSSMKTRRWTAPLRVDRLGASDLPPLNWSSLKYGFGEEHGIDGKEAAHC
jgi:hypothetical protein